MNVWWCEARERYTVLVPVFSIQTREIYVIVKGSGRHAGIAIRLRATMLHVIIVVMLV